MLLRKQIRFHGELGHHGAGVDDLAIALFDHAGKNCLRAYERACKVNADDLIPLCLGHLDHRDSLDDAGVVDKDIYTAEFFFYVLYKSVNLIFVCYVAYNTVSIDSGFLVGCEASVYEVLVDIIKYDLLCACLMKGLCICEAEAVGCAGYPTYLAIESELVKNSCHVYTPSFMLPDLKMRRMTTILF